MAKQLTIRFYQVGRVAEAGMSLRAALTAAANLGPPGAREKMLTGNVRCRLERFDPQPGYLVGEMTRVRDSDFPSEVHPQGITGLGVNVPIGESVVFVYREADHRLAIEYDTRVLSPGRFGDYLGQVAAAAQFVFTPAVDEQAIARFRAQPLRKLKIRLAGAANLGEVENPMEPAASAFRNLGNHYNAPLVTVEMSMGHNKGDLGEGAKEMLEGFLRMVGHGADVRGLTATPDAGEGVQNEDINLLDALLSVKEEVVLPNKQPDACYNIRAMLLRQKLDAHG